MRKTRNTSKRVVMADDDPVSRLLAARALEALGYEVEQVSDGIEALEAIERDRPDLVILDLEMPRLGGFEACEQLRRGPETRAIPVLIATGLTDTETIDQALRAGASDFIKKPLDWQLLQHRVRFLLRAHSMVRDLRRTLADLSESRTRLARAQRLAKLGHWEWEPGSRRMLWSEELYRMFGLELGRDSTSLEVFLTAVHHEDRSAVEKRFQEAEVECVGWALDHRLIGANGEVRVVRQIAEVETSPDGESERVCGTLQDITDKRNAEQQLRELAYSDDLTSLPNRRMLSEYLESELDPLTARRTPLALLVVNLERFARINDTLGHEMGDHLLRMVADRLRTCVDTDGVLERTKAGLRLARIGSDEFAVVLAQIQSSPDATSVARAIHDALAEPFCLGDTEVVMNARVGIAIYPDDGITAEEILRNANTAMHHAKDADESVHFFRASMNERATRNLGLENGLRQALERDELLLTYQPLWEGQSSGINGLEVLVRWPSEEFGLVTPSEFIPLAEQTGLIPGIGEWVLRHACRQGRRWLDEGIDLPRMSVNVSSVQLRRAGFGEHVQSILAETGLPASMLEIEITESALLSDEASVSQNLAELKASGARIALDDFGTGYSSLSHLVKFPIDTLKIDQSFVREIGDGGQTDPLISAVVAMAHRLQLHVVAEGVETPEQEQFLRLVGCDALQGFGLARPLPADGLARLLAEHGRGPAR